MDTVSVPGAVAAERWTAAVSRTFAPVHVSYPGDGPFEGRITADRCGYLEVSTIDADPHRVCRTPRLITPDRRDFVVVALPAAGTVSVRQHGRTAEVTPGDMVVFDTSRPYVLDFRERVRVQTFRVPRRVVTTTDTALGAVAGTAIRADHGVAAMLAPFLTNLAASVGTCDGTVGDRLAGHVVDLVGTLVAERTGRAGDGAESPAKTELIRRVRGYINEHLADPDLSPLSIAAAHHISLRYLYQLFAAEDSTVSRWIQQRRVEEAGRELADGNRMGDGVFTVARRWGFVNASHFSRAFRSVHGMSPSDWRRLRDGAATAPAALPERVIAAP
ncbi:helix-turn-helix domain-containing protein [Yinghuangia seranimata]|uniref:AraC-like ligand-binding domain-containing protein n=1 Tax=Yinghuangia seranimata TaxID=408067 RepID=UPI00248A95D2|nr:helix-turn-helix domain-containing protein [Yinghuangia seranimata]MDI2129005.1 helix-turn-helix domain-containing protein [Yinghuangia seranimata]